MSLRRITSSSFVNYFFLFITSAVLMPFLQLYLKARGFSASRIGLLLGAFELAGVAGPILIGRLADRQAAYRGFLAATLLGSIGFFLPLQITTALGPALACIVAMGFSYRSAPPLLDSLVTRILPDPTRQYGRLRVAGSVAFILVSAFLQLSGLVTGDSAIAILAAFGVSVALAAAVVPLLPAASIHSPDRPGGSARAGAAFDARFWLVIAVIFLGRFGMAAYYSFFSLYLKQTFPGTGVSMLWAVGAGAEVLTIWFSGRLIQRWGIRTMLVVSLAAITVRLSLFIAAPAIPVIAAAQLLHAFTFGTFHTTAIAWINGRVPPERRGLGMAIYSAVGVGLPAFLATVAGGFILEARGFAVLFLSYAAVPLLGIAVLAFFGRGLFAASRQAGVRAA